MKRLAKTISAIMCFAFFNAPAFAEETNAPPPPPMPAHEGMGGMGMMMGGMSEEQMDAHLRQIQEKMLKDYDFMRQIHDAKDEKQQARLKDEWLKAMKQHMKTSQVPQQLKRHGMPEKAPDK